MEYRNLTPAEISQLEHNGNTAQDWDTVYVTGQFDTDKIRNCIFSGEVHIGSTGQCKAHHNALELPVGIYNSMVVNCTIGDNTAIHNVRYISNYTIGDNCLLFNIDEMTSDDRTDWLEPMNECGGRRILPFNGMRTGDAYLWARYRDRREMVEKLEAMTRAELKSAKGGYGKVGNACVVKNCKEIHNVAVSSDDNAKTYISGCVVLSDGVVGYGCTIEDGVMARRFLLGENVKLEMGVRINDSVVGDNSTIARCEVGNCMIFPAHEQHHNNSFLIAALVQGQSNLAAGCTIGSNHNGRTADNEIAAGRGFWPGLCCSLKHSSRFASYCLLAKGAYPKELDIALPFSLVSNNEHKNQLEVMPAYWWMYNMYALNRNEKKFSTRDKRIFKRQHIEFSPLAPDTVEEIVCARELIRSWTEQAYLASIGSDGKIEVTASSMEKGRRKVVIVKAAQAYAAYEEMLIYYAMKVLTEDNAEGNYRLPSNGLKAGRRETSWVNLGGQLITETDVNKLIADIESGTLKTWDDIHQRLDTLWQRYGEDKKRHAYHLLCEMNGIDELSDEVWAQCCKRFEQIKSYVSEQVRITREKDDQNPFRRMTYRNDEEMRAVLS